MSVRPTLSDIIRILLPVLLATAFLYGECRAAPELPPQAGTTDAAAQSPAGTSPEASPKSIEPHAAPRQAVPEAEQAKPASATSYEWSVSRNDRKVRLRGAVPSEEDRRTILGMVKAHFPDLEIDDEQEIAGQSPPKEQWFGAIGFALKQLSHVARGKVTLSDVSLSITGQAKTAGEYAQLRQALYGPLPTGLSLQTVSLQPPAADPFVFTADLHGNMLTLSGNVPSDDLHAKLKTVAAETFRGVTLSDKLTIASGAPNKWEDAVVAALAALSHLEEGKVTLSNSALTIAGMAPDKTTAAQLSFRLKRDLPTVYSTSEKIRWKEAGNQRDIANKIIPRIKEIVDTERLSLQNILPSLDSAESP